MRARFAIAIVGCCAAGACSAFSSSEDVTASDAGPMTDGAAGPDSGTGAEADADAADAADAADGAEAGPPFCSNVLPAPTFCADFENGTIMPPFTMLRGTLKLERSIVFSGGASLQAIGDTGGAYATASRDFTMGFANTAKLSQRIRVSERSATGGGRATASRIVVAPALTGINCTFEIQVSPTQATLVISAGGLQTTTNSLNNVPGAGTWYQVALEVARGPNNYVVARTSVGGVPQTDVMTECPNTVFTGPLRLEIGVQSVAALYEIGFDEIVVVGN